ncbi:recombinase family protein [Nonomuraea mangrovi]|uniref:Recombinase family protein n=1 Tax=Nonomuraea mangrovi TaxID=2316207 RepID=A0ABW4TD67_9ACTN
MFSGKISTRVKARPEREKALKLAHDQEVILTVHELERLARNAAELMTLPTQLQSAGVQLELLTGHSPAWGRCSSPCSLSPPDRRSSTTR